jgi:hypothetical protein
MIAAPGVAAGSQARQLWRRKGPAALTLSVTSSTGVPSGGRYRFSSQRFGFECGIGGGLWPM